MDVEFVAVMFGLGGHYDNSISFAIMENETHVEVWMCKRAAKRSCFSMLLLAVTYRTPVL
jgi:hypothetical protein